MFCFIGSSGKLKQTLESSLYVSVGRTQNQQPAQEVVLRTGSRVRAPRRFLLSAASHDDRVAACHNPECCWGFLMLAHQTTASRQKISVTAHVMLILKRAQLDRNGGQFVWLDQIQKAFWVLEFSCDVKMYFVLLFWFPLSTFVQLWCLFYYSLKDAEDKILKQNCEFYVWRSHMCVFIFSFLPQKF